MELPKVATEAMEATAAMGRARTGPAMAIDLAKEAAIGVALAWARIHSVQCDLTIPTISRESSIDQNDEHASRFSAIGGRRGRRRADGRCSYLADHK